jgi:hypothetical protein
MKGSGEATRVSQSASVVRVLAMRVSRSPQSVVPCPYPVPQTSHLVLSVAVRRAPRWQTPDTGVAFLPRWRNPPSGKPDRAWLVDFEQEYASHDSQATPDLIGGSRFRDVPLSITVPIRRAA